MLRRSFLHLRGVGRELERRLWGAGVTSWEELKAFRGHIPGIGEKKLRAFVEGVALSEKRLAAGDARFFHDGLPASERWRMAREFRDRLAFLDIETTGMGPSAVTTVVGVYAGGRARLFVRGADLDEFPAFAEPFDVWVTYNGLTFDEPFLRREFGERVRPAAHVDLRYCLGAVGLKGGLKEVERAVGPSMGIKRPSELAELDGWDAVRLWNEYEAGNVDSLMTLLRYNLEDILNLEPLLELAVRRHVETRQLPMRPFVIESTPTSREAAGREAVAEVGRRTGYW